MFQEDTLKDRHILVTGGGSGLGLAIVREIAQRHAARIDLFDNPHASDPRFPGLLIRISVSLATRMSLMWYTKVKHILPMSNYKTPFL